VDESHLKPICIWAFEQAGFYASMSCSYTLVCFFKWPVTWKFTWILYRIHVVCF